MDFSKIWATNGNVSEPTDAHKLQGFSFLGSAPPTEELFNWLFKDYALKLQNLYAVSRQWKASTAYDVGDICYSAIAASYKYMECTVSGISGAAEPVWPAAGSTVTDGTVTWIVRDTKKPFRGALVYRGSGGNQSVAPGIVKVALNTVLYDATGFWDAINTRFVIPSNVSKVRLCGSVLWTEGFSTVNTRALNVYKNGSSVYGSSFVIGSSTATHKIVTEPLIVTQGDYIELYASNFDGTSRNVSQSTSTYLSLEVLA